jgi:hypothetical protein
MGSVADSGGHPDAYDPAVDGCRQLSSLTEVDLMNPNAPAGVAPTKLRLAVRPATVARAACLVYGALLAILAAGLHGRAGWATAIWPWTDVRMSFVFLASIATAVAAASIWIALTGETAAVAGVALSSVVTNLGIAAYLTGRAVVRDEPPLLVWIVGSLGFFVASLAVLRWGLRQPVRCSRSAPAGLRWVFLGYTTVLLTVGIALVGQGERVFPWDLSAGTSTLFGSIFIGAAAFFAYGAVRGSRALATAQLWAFLAYDVVLLIPYAGMIGDEGAAGGGYYGGYSGYGTAATGGDGVNERSLAVYLTVLAASTAVSLWYGAVQPLRERGWSWRGLTLSAGRT